MLASFRRLKTMAELCREHDIADSLLRKWRERFLATEAERRQGRRSAPGPTRCVAGSRAWSVR